MKAATGKLKQQLTNERQNKEWLFSYFSTKFNFKTTAASD